MVCKKCSLGETLGELPPVVEKPPEEKVEQKPISNVKPVKQLLINDKKLRNYYIRFRRKGLKTTIEKDEFEDEDPEAEFLKIYNEFFVFQNQIQTEVVYEFLDEIKAEKKEFERINREKMMLEQPNDKRKEYDAENKVFDDAINVDDDLDEEEPNSRVSRGDEDPRTSGPAPEPSPSEAKNAYEKIKSEITSHFTKTFVSSEIYQNLTNPPFLTELNKSGEVTRKVMPISSVELTLFRSTESLFKMVTKAMPSAKIFWNNSHPFHPDVFAKTIEFYITGTSQQSNLMRDIFKLMEDTINWYKRASGFTTATIYVPAIYLKRVVGEFQKNM